MTAIGIPNSLDETIWNAILADAQRRMPGYKVVAKATSGLSWFSPTYASTMLLTSYMPPAALDGWHWWLLGHEQLHASDYSANKAWWIVSYLFPQWLALGSFGAFGAFASLWFLLLLGSIVFVFLPSPFRTHWERRGYMMSICLLILKYGESYVTSGDYIAGLVAEYTTCAYLWMDPFATTVEAWVRDDIRRGIAIVRGEYDDPTFGAMVALVRGVVAKASAPAVA